MSSSITWLIVLALSVGSAAWLDRATATELSESEVKELFEEGDAQRQGALKAAKEMLKTSQNNLAHARKGKYYNSGFLDDFRTDNEKKKAIAKYQEECTQIQKHLAQLNNKALPIVPDILDSPDVGSVGHLRFTATIKQKLSDTEALLEIPFQTKVSQQFATSVTSEFLVYCKGFNFKNAADGNGFRITTPVEVTKTTTYKTVLGASKTVPMIEPVNLSTYIEAEKKARMK